jgi:hypothetical protein
MRGDRSFAYDLIDRGGGVSGRVVLLLRSTEPKPLQLGPTRPVPPLRPEGHGGGEDNISGWGCPWALRLRVCTACGYGVQRVATGSTAGGYGVSSVAISCPVVVNGLDGILGVPGCAGGRLGVLGHG